MKKHKEKFKELGLLFIGGIILTIGDIVAKEWIHTGGNYLYIFIMLMYLVGMFFLVSSYKLENIEIASTVLIIFNITTLTLIGILLFNEEISLKKIIGISLGLIAVILLELKKGK